MTSFTIKVEDQDVIDALKEASAHFHDMTPVMRAISIRLLERTQARFDSGTDPTGEKWERNSDATLSLFASKTAEKRSYRRKNGELNKRGQLVFSNKRLLYVGGDLSTKIYSGWRRNEAMVTARMPYAAIQHFGGKTGAKSWFPGATIPARPFMPIRADGTLYESDRKEVFSALNTYISEHLNRLK